MVLVGTYSVHTYYYILILIVYVYNPHTFTMYYGNGDHCMITAKNIPPTRVGIFIKGHWPPPDSEPFCAGAKYVELVDITSPVVFVGGFVLPPHFLSRNPAYNRVS